MTCCEHPERDHKYHDVSLYVDVRTCVACECREYVEVTTYG